MALQYQRSLGRAGQAPADDVAGRLSRRHVHPDERLRPRRRHALDLDRRARRRRCSRPQVPAEYDPAYSAAFEAQLAEHADELAAVIVEPVVQGAGGMRFHDPRYLTDLRAACTRHDVLLIFDEIATGFGRTGELFAADHAGVMPGHHVRRQGVDRGYLTLAATLCTRRGRRDHQRRRAGRADARADVHGQRAGVRGVGGVGGAAARSGLAAAGARDRGGPADGLAPARELRRGRRRPGARRDRGDRDARAGRHGGGHRGRAARTACGCARSAIWSTRCRRTSARPTRWRRSARRWSASRVR